MPEGVTNYTVKTGDTMNAIARRFNVSVDDLIAANPQFRADSRGGGYSAGEARKQAKMSTGRDVDYIRKNETIHVPTKGAGQPKVVPTANRTTSSAGVEQRQVRVNEAPSRNANVATPTRTAAPASVAKVETPKVEAPKVEAAKSETTQTTTQQTVTTVTTTTTTVTTAPSTKPAAETAARSDWEPEPTAKATTTTPAATTPVATTPAVATSAVTAPATDTKAQPDPAPVAATTAEAKPEPKKEPDPPKPPTDPNAATNLQDKPYRHQIIVTGGGSGSKDPRSADNRIGFLAESLDTGANLNNGTYQFSASLTKPGRIQEPDSRFDATGRMTLLSFGRKQLEVTNADRTTQKVESFGMKFGGMKAADRFGSVSIYGNVSGLQIGAIQQENGKAVDGKSATSPAHLGFGASLGNMTGYYAHGIGNGQVRDPATGLISSTHTNIYGVDLAVPFKADQTKKFWVDKMQFGLNGRQTVMTPEGGQPGRATYANTAYVESFMKVHSGKMPSLLPGRSASTTFDAVGTFRTKFETTTSGKIDPKLTLRYDQPMWEVRNTKLNADGSYSVTTQTRVEAFGALQLGRGSDTKPAVQNVTFGLRARF